jgi:hypothetical protein
MAIPGFSAEATLEELSGHRHTVATLDAPPSSGHVTPQLKICTPCIQVGGEPYCVTILGKRICLPALGRWKGCCRTVWGWPPVRCSIDRC